MLTFPVTLEAGLFYNFPTLEPTAFALHVGILPRSRIGFLRLPEEMLTNLAA